MDSLSVERRRRTCLVQRIRDFVDVATEVGARRDYELTKLAFYAYLADKGDMDDAELREAVREVLAELGDDPTVRSALQVIANGSLARIAGLR